jgi:hypothetical protein
MRLHVEISQYLCHVTITFEVEGVFEQISLVAGTRSPLPVLVFYNLATDTMSFDVLQNSGEVIVPVMLQMRNK